MKAKTRKTYRIVLSVAAIVLSVLTASSAYGFLGGTGWSFAARFWVGLLFMETPVAVSLLVMEYFRMEKANVNPEHVKTK